MGVGFPRVNLAARLQASPMLRRMARLLYALSLLLEDGILTAAMGRMEPGTLDADAPHCLAGLLHVALQDMANGYAAHAAIPLGSLHAFLKVGCMVHCQADGVDLLMCLCSMLLVSLRPLSRPATCKLAVHLPGSPHQSNRITMHRVLQCYTIVLSTAELAQDHHSRVPFIGLICGILGRLYP